MQSTEPEIWKSVVGHEGLYEVSDHGRVRSLDRVVQRKDGLSRRAPGRILRASKHDAGYLKVTLWRDNRGRWVSVHVLVLEAFVGPCPDGMEALHADDVPTHNTPANLRWGTKRENRDDAVRNGGHHMTKRTRCPRGHRLIEPNLRPDKLRIGRRTCLACTREQNRARDQHRPFDDARADTEYERIMSR